MARVTAAVEKATAALQEAIEKPGTERTRRAAECIVALRKLFKHDGMTDWAGRSPGYRDCIERVYRQAGVPSDSESNVQANLRYHIGNVLRKVAPPEDLAALGMAVESPLGRVRQARADRPARPRARRVIGPVVGDPAAMAAVALAAVQAVSTMSPGAEVEPALRQVIDEALNVLAALRN